jgi:hypothetical protein
MTHRIAFAAILLGACSLACSIFVGGPKYPPPLTFAATKVPGTLQAHIEQAVSEGATSGVLTLKITQSELTDFLAAQLAAQPRPLISEPVVVLRDGAMIVYGKATSGFLTGNVGITTQFTVDEAGQPQISITQADFGPLPAPDALRTAISAFLQETLAGSFGPVAIGFRLERIDIADGVMTVTGRIK